MMLNQTLPRTPPERQGIASSAILRFVEALESTVHEIHSVMLLRHGSVVAEGWWSPYEPEHPHLLFSVSKSFTSTGVGLAVSEGYFSLDDPVVSFFPDEAPADVSEHLAAMRVRDLLTMSTGQDVDSWSAMMARPDRNWLKGFFDVPVLHIPGTHFVYNTGATYLLSAIVQKTTGLKLIDYLEPRLFAPLGIRNATWQDSPQGITAGGIGLSITTEDIARFGQLLLQKGVWQGQQLLPEAWVNEATSFQVSNGNDPQSDWTQGYGYQFWRCRHGAYRADGAFGQFCIVMPEQDAVLAITAGVDLFDMQQPLDLVWELLLPAMQAEALPDDAEAQAALTTRLSALGLPTVQGQAISPVATQVSGRSYAVDLNARGIEIISLNFTEAGCTFSIKTATGDETIPCGYGTWERGETSLFRHHLLFDRLPVASSGAWTADDRYTIVIRLVETPFYHTLVCHFVGDELMVEATINVSLESLEPLLLTARAVQPTTL
jgi:CubicO group peptidase (beta-lactamase class C family)